MSQARIFFPVKFYRNFDNSDWDQNE
uniref:Uncharacterized protein n=1 Tax=Arundo donax TaxID=35708 RepID=A0A0A8YX08_ARUDO